MSEVLEQIAMRTRVVEYEILKDDKLTPTKLLISNDDYRLLVEQARKVKNLEEHVSRFEWQTKTMKKRQGVINKLSEQNKRYREVLKDILNNDETYITNEEIILEVLEGEK